MCLATLQVCLTEKKICPWTAVQQDTQRLGKARGLGVLQSVSLAEINQGGSAPALRGPSSLGVKAAGLRSQMQLTYLSVYTLQAAGPAAEMENFLILLFSDDKMMRHYRNLRKKITHHFMTPTKVFSFHMFPSRLSYHSFIFYAVGEN